MWGKKHRFGQDFENFAQKWDKKYCFGQDFEIKKYFCNFAVQIVALCLNYCIT